MPAIVGKYGGVKLVTRYPERIPSLESQILLYEISTGNNLALMDGTWITTMRTGAVAVHTIQNLAVKGFSTIGIIGLGNTARATVLILLSVYAGQHFVIKLKKYKDQHVLFAERFVDYTNVKFEFCDEYEQVISDSDVVISAATYFQEDICGNECFKEGVLVIPIHTRGFTNCDLFFDKVFADDENHVKGFKYFNKFKKFAEMTDVVNGVVEGRENDSERIIAYNIGVALHDIFFAGKIYELTKHDIPTISLGVPEEKFWV